MSQEISIVKTGRGLAGSRIALVFAPPDAKVGELAQLTDFLNEQPNIRAVAGYHGPNQNHVLRVSGIPDDAAFLALLKRSGSPVAAGTRCAPIDEVDHFPHQTALRRSIKENANTLTGLTYMAGSMALLLAAWRKPKHLPNKPPHDWYRSYTALAYFTASAILVALSRKTDNPRDVYTIMESVYPSLENANEADRQQMQEQAGKAVQFIRNHPWEITMLLNASGAASHAVSSYKRGWKMELAAALATLTACTTSAVIPEKGGRSMVPIADWLEDKEGHGFLQRLEGFADAHPMHRGWVEKATAAADWLQENPLKVSSYVFGAANVGYAASGIKQKNYPLTAMSAAFGLGNYTQSQASKGRGDGFDSVVTAAASILANDAALQKLPADQVQQRIEALAEKLTDQREIVHPKARLVRGIKARMNKEFLPFEERVLRESPFARPQQWQEVAARQQQARAEGGAEHSRNFTQLS